VGPLFALGVVEATRELDCEEESTRALSSEEYAVVRRELEASVAAARFVAVSAVVLSAALLFATVKSAQQGSWFLVVLFAALIALALVSTAFVLRGTRFAPAFPPELRARVVRARCESRVEGQGKHQRTVRYVGSHRVDLRSGWQAFWPEGAEVVLELCFPPESIGVT
jgi:hypothetical protein